MKPSAESIVESFEEVAMLAGVELRTGDLRIEELGVPHKPTGLPSGSMVVYVFSYKGSALKVGKAGPNSDARYRSQHYNPSSAPSTLAASILKNSVPIGKPNLDVHSVGNWIRQNTGRTNFILKASCGIHVLNLLESFIQCILKPTYEGFASQR